MHQLQLAYLRHFFLPSVLSSRCFTSPHQFCPTPSYQRDFCAREPTRWFSSTGLNHLAFVFSQPNPNTIGLSFLISEQFPRSGSNCFCSHFLSTIAFCPQIGTVFYAFHSMHSASLSEPLLISSPFHQTFD